MEISQLYPTLGKNIRDARIRAQMTQDDLAKSLGLQRTSITNIESGSQKIQLHTLYMLASALDVNLISLLPDTSSFEFRGIKKELKKKKNLSADEKNWIRRIVTESEKEE
ncbi:MAG: helix-turn-helix transcriptional regulator [Aggregatilineales bacterium]